MRALVIDNDPDRRSRMTALLETPGIWISATSQTLSAIRAVPDSRPDVIFLGLDSADSWALYALAAAAPDVPVVGYAEDYDPEFGRSAVASGASRVISLKAQKPALLEAIVRVIKTR